MRRSRSSSSRWRSSRRATHAARAGADRCSDDPRPASSRAKPVRKALPAHLPRETRVHQAACNCPSCGGELKVLGEDVSEVLEYVPSRFKVLRHVRPKLACAQCQTHHASRRARAGDRPRPCRTRACSPTCWCRSTAITCRCTGRARSTRVKGWSCHARRSPTGSGSAARCCDRWSTRSVSTCCRARSCMPMTSRCRCCSPGAARRSRVDCGPTCAMIGRPRALNRRRCGSPTARIARASTRART